MCNAMYSCAPPDSGTLPLIFHSVCSLWYSLWLLFSTVFRKLVVTFSQAGIFSLQMLTLWHWLQCFISCVFIHLPLIFSCCAFWAADHIKAKPNGWPLHLDSPTAFLLLDAGGPQGVLIGNVKQSWEAQIFSQLFCFVVCKSTQRLKSVEQLPQRLLAINKMIYLGSGWALSNFKHLCPVDGLCKLVLSCSKFSWNPVEIHTYIYIGIPTYNTIIYL